MPIFPNLGENSIFPNCTGIGSIPKKVKKIVGWIGFMTFVSNDACMHSLMDSLTDPWKLIWTPRI